MTTQLLSIKLKCIVFPKEGWTDQRRMWVFTQLTVEITQKIKLNFNKNTSFSFTKILQVELLQAHQVRQSLQKNHLRVHLWKSVRQSHQKIQLEEAMIVHSDHEHTFQSVELQCSYCYQENYQGCHCIFQTHITRSYVQVHSQAHMKPDGHAYACSVYSNNVCPIKTLRSTAELH